MLAGTALALLAPRGLGASAWAGQRPHASMATTTRRTVPDAWRSTPKTLPEKDIRRFPPLSPPAVCACNLSYTLDGKRNCYRPDPTVAIIAVIPIGQFARARMAPMLATDCRGRGSVSCQSALPVSHQASFTSSRSVPVRKPWRLHGLMKVACPAARNQDRFMHRLAVFVARAQRAGRRQFRPKSSRQVHIGHALQSHGHNHTSA